MLSQHLSMHRAEHGKPRPRAGGEGPPSFSSTKAPSFMPKSHRSQGEVCSCTPVLSERSLALEATEALLPESPDTRTRRVLEPAPLLWLPAVAARAEVLCSCTVPHPTLNSEALSSDSKLVVLQGGPPEAQSSQTGLPPFQRHSLGDRIWKAFSLGGI